MGVFPKGERSVNFKMPFSCYCFDQNTNETFFRICALTSKKRLNNKKEKGTLFFAHNYIKVF